MSGYSEEKLQHRIGDRLVLQHISLTATNPPGFTTEAQTRSAFSNPILYAAPSDQSRSICGKASGISLMSMQCTPPGRQAPGPQRAATDPPGMAHTDPPRQPEHRVPLPAQGFDAPSRSRHPRRRGAAVPEAAQARAGCRQSLPGPSFAIPPNRRSIEILSYIYSPTNRFHCRIPCEGNDSCFVRSSGSRLPLPDRRRR